MSCRHECTHTSPSNCRNGLSNPILIFLEDNNDAESAAHEQSHTDIDDRQPAGTLWLLGKTVYSTTSSWVVAVQIKNSIGFIIWNFIYWGCPLTVDFTSKRFCIWHCSLWHGLQNLCCLNIFSIHSFCCDWNLHLKTIYTQMEPFDLEQGLLYKTKCLIRFMVGRDHGLVLKFSAAPS